MHILIRKGEIYGIVSYTWRYFYCFKIMSSYFMELDTCSNAIFNCSDYYWGDSNSCNYWVYCFIRINYVTLASVLGFD